MRNVRMVVAVLITSCHVSLKPKMGPVTIHASISITAETNTIGLPVMRDVVFAIAEYHEE
jgi:hypothetical protein